MRYHPHVWARALGALLLASGCVSAPRAAPARVDDDAPREAPLIARWGTEPSPPLPELPAPLPVPEGLDAPLRRAWTHALALGAPDPRHGAPHEVDVFDSSVWSTEPQTRREIGFVLPHRPGERPFAIVDRLIYPLVSLGPAVDLRVSCAETRDALRQLGPMPELEEGGDRRWWFEAWEAAWARCPSLNAALFLAETDPSLASALGPASYWEAQHYPRVRRDLVGGWLASAFERAVTAHMRGDDRIARHDAHVVARVLPLVEAAMREAGADERALRELDYLRVAHDLARDQDRRAERGARAPSPEIPEQGEVPPELVPELIEHLDEVQVGQWGQPGGVPLEHSPIVDALIRVGASAVPPLIDALEHDGRLTRSVHFWRDFARPRTVLGVHEAAYAALVAILGVSFFQPVATGDNLTRRGDDPRAQLADRVRDYWVRYGQHPPAEGRYRVLADDDAPPDQQVEAAAWLTRPEGQSSPQGSMVGIVWVGLPAGPLAGEALRSRTSPSITQLLARRMDASGEDGRGLSRGCSFAEALARWSPPEAPALSVSFARRCVAAAECSCAPGIVSFAGEREPALLDAYARRVRRSREEVSAYELAPIVHYPDHTAMRQLVRWLFEAGPFVATQGDAWQARRVVEALAESGAIDLPAVRGYVGRALEVDREVGRLTPRGNDAWVEYANGGFSVELPEPATAAQSVRVRDLYAYSLARVLSIEFSLGWDRERRDAAIAAMRAQLSSAPRP